VGLDSEDFGLGLYTVSNDSILQLVDQGDDAVYRLALVPIMHRGKVQKSKFLGLQQRIVNAVCEGLQSCHGELQEVNK
jgi:hypothetical protein